MFNKNKKLQEELKKVQEQYQENKGKAMPLTRPAYMQMGINFLWAVFNMYMFFENRNVEKFSFFNFWVMFFLLLMNIPLFTYKENEKEGKNKFVAIYFFCALLVFTLFPFFISYNLAMVFTVASWLPNYIYSYSIKDKKVIDSLKGNTGCFMIFWLGLLVISIIISISRHSLGTEIFPAGYNYGYFINMLYNIFFIVSIYYSNRYRNMSV
ncbi:hypothetical protein [Chryseobacterium rhizosphaerae]|uniref:Uncharacterized protein n=1 Tax=Chryseobacterium rhizosphaerae TaxID=395937 RepID=A0ABX9IFT0_9FLAO|nr:hypothetical protein [Chryseobacterium rhizosphaerae]REC71157.1 hypothetical protein DRF57_21065 [Chryseobacterium rhizosphaerae]GEN67613.1 hypothetical protein CRH01_21810 [Chryseobacterium rhizosphaerae]